MTDGVYEVTCPDPQAGKPCGRCWYCLERLKPAIAKLLTDIGTVCALPNCGIVPHKAGLCRYHWFELEDRARAQGRRERASAIWRAWGGPR